MKLDAWMEQDHPLDESLRLIESLCQAVNEIHDRGDALGALQPDRIEVGPGGNCDISAASGGTPSPAYAPPDGEGDAAADVFAAGMIAWEVLAGRSAGESPQHLAEVRPDISKELADAIMACLERSADWRPKDLTFLAQMAAARQKSAGRPAQQRRTAKTSRRSPGRTRSHREGRRTWPLLAALVVVVALAFFAWQQFGGTDGFPWSRTAPAPEGPPPAAPVTEPAPPADPAAPPVDAPPVDAPTTAPVPDPTATAGDAPPADAATQPPPPAEPAPTIPPETETAPPPPPATAPAPAVAPPPAQTAPPEPPPTSRPAPSTQPVVPPAPAAPPPAAPDTSGAGQPAAPAPRPEVRPAPATAPEPAPPAPPAVLTAVSPLEVKRPGQVLLDLRGQGFQEQHLVRVLAVKKPPRGITVVRQKRDNETLIKVLLDLSEDADTGDYALVLENSLGERTESVVFKVTK